MSEWPDLSPHIGKIARRLLGPPNESLSTPQQLRFGTNGSVAVEIDGPNRGQWFDHEHQLGGGPHELLKEKGSMSNGTAAAWLKSEFGIETRQRKGKGKLQIVKTYDYRDETGKLLFQVCRLDPKDFRQRSPVENGGWSWSTKGVRKVLYRLPSVLAAAPDSVVYVVEGEKDVDALSELGLVATCNAGGAGKWRSDYNAAFRGRDVVVVQDNDDAGRQHTVSVASNLAPVARRVRILELPGLPDKGDVSDWLAAGGTLQQLDALVAAAPDFQPASATPAKDAAISPQYSDDALALEFSTRHAGNLRHVAKWGSWLFWTGAVWNIENTYLAFDLARAVAREFANRCPDEDDQPKIASARTVAAIEKLARADRRQAVTHDIWDNDPWLLNTPGGIVDLRNGEMRPHDPTRYMTKITAVAPGGYCPRWRQFLNEITAGDADLQAYLQRIAGYSLTGITTEHALFFHYGTGGNGKGVYLNTLSAILGDYAAVAPMETFIATNGERHPTDLAGLRGARLVTSQETEEGRRWAESKIKSLTGGDPISARFMRQDFFTYSPQFKLNIAGNHKPGLRGVDAAIRRRFNLVPFTVTIEHPDPKLVEKLQEEWPGILQWAITGCLAWQREGLNPPAAVRNATDAYLGDEDSVARWIEDCCIIGDCNLWAASGALWNSWKPWAEVHNERVGSQRGLGDALDSHGYQRGKNQDVRGYHGIALKPAPQPAPGYDFNDVGPREDG